jgi:hypothetical protein
MPIISTRNSCDVYVERPLLSACRGVDACYTRRETGRTVCNLNLELVASIEAIGDRGQREVTCHAVPFRLP